MRACVRLSVRASGNTFRHEYFCNRLADWNEILSEASLGWWKGFNRFGPDWIRTLVSMAIDSSHSYNGENGVNTFSQMLLIGSFILAYNDDMHESLDEFEIWSDSTTDYGDSCP